MKKSCLVVLIILISIPIFGENSEKKFGLQLSSDTSVQLVFRPQWLELGLGVQVFQGDGNGVYANAGLIKPNMYASFRFNSDDDPFTLTTGIGAGTGFGTDDVEYDEFLDLSLRVGFDYNLNDHFRVSGILYPIWLETREVSEGNDAWGLTAQIPRAAVAVAYFF